VACCELKVEIEGAYHLSKLILQFKWKFKEINFPPVDELWETSLIIIQDPNPHQRQVVQREYQHSKWFLKPHSKRPNISSLNFPRNILKENSVALSQSLQGESADSKEALVIIFKHLEKISKHHNKEIPRVEDFPRDHKWFNSMRPLSFRNELKNKLVVIDFWTYCCINCLHCLPDLEYLEQKFKSRSEVVFMGCHSAKFTNEMESEEVRRAVLRYKVKHPVINDCHMKVWKKLGVKCWPSFMVISPVGYPIVLLSGEGHKTRLELIVTACLQYYGK
jgi:thiol-disulfide isomerase/thioredoxin